jgi:hypothetical protein
MPRQLHKSLLISAAIVVVGGAPAAADVTISTAATQNMNCSGGVCAPTAANAVLNVGDLESLLGSGDLEVTTTGSGVQAGNLKIAATLAWSTGSSLTLDAYKSVSVEKPVNVTGSGGVSVITNDGGAKGAFAFGPKGSLTFANLSDSFTLNRVSYTLEANIASLASVIAANPSGAYALAVSYDASQDGTYASAPVGTVLTGAFNGLGNTISDLTINDPTQNDSVGLFAGMSGSASIASIVLANANVTGGAGVYDSSSEYVGALIGYEDGGTISNAFASGAVSGGSYAGVGGLVGVSMAGSLSASGAAVATSSGSLGGAGGLVGVADGAITNSYATGNVSGSVFVGGLVGDMDIASIDQSFATGTVTGTDTYTYAGGLVGMNQSTVSRSFATGAVNCQLSCGGLVGMNGGGFHGSTISHSYATGAVSGSAAGGLVGYNSGSLITDSYANGSATGTGAGGLIGDNTGTIARSYSSGAVSATEYAGGLIGYDQISSIKHAYWDTTTSGIADKAQGAGNVQNDPGIKGLSDAKLRSGLPNGFNSRVWTENANVNAGLPYLVDNPPAK